MRLAYLMYTLGLARFGDLTARVQGYFTDDIYLAGPEPRPL